jgi:hypothetical protein
MQHMGGGGGRARDTSGGQDRSQDWSCSECGNMNYGYRHTCSK